MQDLEVCILRPAFVIDDTHCFGEISLHIPMLMSEDESSSLHLFILRSGGGWMCDFLNGYLVFFLTCVAKESPVVFPKLCSYKVPSGFEFPSRAAAYHRAYIEFIKSTCHPGT